jgi:hypothetical protein
MQCSFSPRKVRSSPLGIATVQPQAPVDFFSGLSSGEQKPARRPGNHKVYDGVIHRQLINVATAPARTMWSSQSSSTRLPTSRPPKPLGLTTFTLPALKRRSEKIGWIEGHNLEGIVGCFLRIGPLVAEQGRVHAGGRCSDKRQRLTIMSRPWVYLSD